MDYGGAGDASIDMKKMDRATCPKHSQKVTCLCSFILCNPIIEWCIYVCH